jgi:hypothetical protein
MWVVDGLARALDPVEDVLLESDAGTLSGSRAMACERPLRGDLERDPTPARMLARSSSVVRKLHRTVGFESGIGVRRPTLPRESA